MKNRIVIPGIITFAILFTCFSSCKKDSNGALEYLTSYYEINKPYTFIFKDRGDTTQSIKIVFTMDQEGMVQVQESYIPKDPAEINGVVLFMPSSEYDLATKSIYQTRNDMSMYFEWEVAGMYSHAKYVGTGERSSGRRLYFKSATLLGDTTSQNLVQTQHENAVVWTNPIDSFFVSSEDIIDHRGRNLLFFQCMHLIQ